MPIPPHVVHQLYEVFKRRRQISTDSRKVQPGDLFFALRGDNFDGNAFALSSLQQGAILAVIDDPALKDHPSCYFVDDCLSALQALATHHRSQLDIPVIAITGSNGKTTTKELIAQVLSSRYSLQYTKGNLNNHIGVPLTILSIAPEVEVAVVEMGANHQREIANLCQIAQPTHGLITNIGKAHLEGFGGLQGVIKGKGELFDYLAASGGMAFFNKDEPHLSDMVRSVPRSLAFTGNISAAELCRNSYSARLLGNDPFVSAEFCDEQDTVLRINSRLIGAYNFKNILAAIALGKYFKVPCQKIRESIESYIPTNNRSQLLDWHGNTVVLDAYNANPTSMTQALTHFSQTQGGFKMAILGDMLELGPYSVEEHEKITQLALNCGLDQLILIGVQFAKPAMVYNILHFEDVFAAAQWMKDNMPSQASILIKGSRGMGLERILQ